VAILDLLRTSEALRIIHELGVESPRVPNTQMRGALTDIFKSLDPIVVHGLMVSTLKLSRSQSGSAELLRGLPPSLRAAMLAAKLNRVAQERVQEATSVPLDVALAWS
jgi:hypothetical protein